MQLEHLIRRYPFVFHMAEADSWENIRRLGLLSTSAALDLYGIEGQQRFSLESQHRPEKADIHNQNLEPLVLRDQKPMNDHRLFMALNDGTTPQEWYELLNAKVFFWATRERLLTLLNARAYRDSEHDVLTLDTRSLLSRHADSAWLCHMNSGNTFPVPHQRGRDIFRRIPDYPAKDNGSPVKEVAELVIDYHVPDIEAHVVRVQRMQGSTIIRNLA